METKITFPSVKKKKMQEPVTRNYGKALFIFTLVTVVLTVIASVFIKNALQDFETYKATEVMINQSFALNMDAKFPGSVEEIVIKADPSIEDAYSALLRIRLENAEIVSFTPSLPITVGTCKDGLMYEADKICADIAKDTPFEKGDVLGLLKVRWGADGLAKLFTTEGNGYFSNELVEYNPPQAVVAVSGELPMTGEFTFVKYLNIVGGVVITLLSAYLLYRVYKTNKTKGRKLLFIEFSITLTGLVVVAILFTANYNNTQNKYSLMWKEQNIGVLPMTGEAASSSDTSFQVNTEVCTGNNPINGKLPNNPYVITYEITPISRFPDVFYGFLRKTMHIKVDNNAKIIQVNDENLNLDFGDFYSFRPKGWDTIKIKVLFQSDDGQTFSSTISSYFFDRESTEHSCFKHSIKYAPVSMPPVTSVPSKFSSLTNKNTPLGSVVVKKESNAIKITLSAPCKDVVSGNIALVKLNKIENTVMIQTNNENGRLKTPLEISGIYSEASDFKSLKYEINDKYTYLLDTINGKNDDNNLGNITWSEMVRECERILNPSASDELVAPSVDPRPAKADGGVSSAGAPADGAPGETDPPAASPANPDISYQGGSNGGSGTTNTGDIVVDKNEDGSYTYTVDGDPNIGGGYLPPNQTTAAPAGKLQCGAPACKSDADCMTGLPDYECNESATNWPNNNKCVKVCPAGQTNVGDCSCSSDATAASGKLQCGAPACKTDADCMTGLPDYECNESATNWPNNNKCVRVCPPGQMKVGDCACNSDPLTGVACGQIDYNDDGILDIRDLVEFAKVYNRQCYDNPAPSACGGKDTNADKKVTILDLPSFARRYYSVASSCKII